MFPIKPGRSVSNTHFDLHKINVCKFVTQAEVAAGVGHHLRKSVREAAATIIKERGRCCCCRIDLDTEDVRYRLNSPGEL